MDEQQRNSLDARSTSQKLLDLTSLAMQLQAHPAQPDPLLRDYVSTYIESHHRSDQFFTTLCEHRFLVLLFENSSKIAEPTCVLECLNLLITNTRGGQELVYLLSQGALHEYLFGTGILRNDYEFIEYYVQLLKTILMKISEDEENKSLIRMFCNNKYPTFPLLTYATILASDSNELTRVTAQQCILVLVGMINEKKIYETYLSEPPMLIFIVRLATQFLKPDTDHEGICKYLADLMFELKGNRVPLFFIANILCNVIIVASLPSRTTVALSFVELLGKAIQTRVLEHKGILANEKSDAYYQKKPITKSRSKFFEMFGEASCDNLILICATYYRILVKYMTNKYLNSAYLSAFIALCPSANMGNKPQQPQISLPLKVTYPGPQVLWKMLQEYNFKKYFDQEYPISEIDIGGSDFMNDIEDKINEYASSKEFIKTKDAYLKKIGSSSKTPAPPTSFFGRIFNRGTPEQLSTQYMRHVSDFCNLCFVKGEPVSSSLSRQFAAQGCPFFSQFILITRQLRNGLKYDNIKTGQESDTVEPDEIHFNDVRALWAFSHSNLDIIGVMAQRFVEFINVESTEANTLVVPRLYIPPCYLFLGQFKEYLGAAIHEHINREAKNQELMNSITMLITLSRVCSHLNVKLTQNCYISLIGQLTSLHQQLQTCLFQNGFHDVVQYVRSKNKLIMMDIEDRKGRERDSKKMEEEGIKMSDRKMSGNTGIRVKVKPGITFIKLCSFQSIQKIMDPHIKPLLRFFQLKWRQTFQKTPHISQFQEQPIAVYKVSYFGKAGCVLSFTKLLKPPTIVLRIELAHKKLLQIDITDLEGIRKNTIDPRVLQFGGGNVENVKTETIEIGEDIVERFRQCKFMYEECITNATLEYLASTNETLAIKSKQIGRTSQSRISQSFQTPQ